MNIEMNVASRITMITNMPLKGSITDMTARRSIMEKISFSSEELESINLTEDNGTLKWDPLAKPVIIDFTNNEIKFLQYVIQRMDILSLITENILDFANTLNEINTEEECQ